MSLEGYLDDLGICDILQIVSLSKKSGTLSLSSDAGKGAISFLDGQVVRAVSSEFPSNLGTVLCLSELTTRQQIIDAVTQQKAPNEQRPLGAIISDLYHIPQEKIEAVVQQQIEAIVLSFLDWTSGTFSFHLEEQQSFGSTSINPLDLMLEQGIPPQSFVAVGASLAADSVEQDADEASGLDKNLGKRDLDQLRGMLAELENPSMSGGIILLILRYASELLSRAIIFDVRGRELVGIGQFGLSSQSGSADDIVRKMRLKIDSNSLFGRVIQHQTALCGKLGSLPDESFVSEILGGQAEGVFVGPLVSDGKVVAILYGDNYPEKGELKAAKAFEVFLSQAGMVMEQVLQNTTEFK